jgi:hypothetical protein
MGKQLQLDLLTVHSVNNTDKDMNQPSNLTHDCCIVTGDALHLGGIQLETTIKASQLMMGICI